MTDISPDAPSPARIVNRQTGEAFDVDSSRVAESLAARGPTGEPLFELDTPELANQRRLRREYGGVAGQIGAGAAGAARVLTFGGSDQVAALADELGGTSGTGGNVEALNAMRDLNPGATMLGEGAATLATALVPGGGVAGAARGVEGVAARTAASEGASAFGLLARTARATAPSRAVTLVADVVEGGAARLLSGQSGAVQAFGRYAAGGAVEGAASGLQQALTEDALGNRELTAQSLLADVGLGAVLGAGTGGLFGVGGYALQRGASGLRRATSDVMDRAFRGATGEGLRAGVGDLWDATARRVADVSSMATGADREAIEAAISSSGRRTRELVSRGDELYETATREIQRAGSEAEVGLRHTQDFWGRGLKRGTIDAQVSTERVLDQLGAARSSVAQMRGLASEVIANPGFEANGIAGNAREILRYADQAQSIIDSAAAREGAGQAAVSADLFEALDAMKRSVGRAQQRIERQDRGSVFLGQIRDAYETALRRPLEDTSLWGDVANTQREVNAAYTRHLERRSAFSRAFLADGARDTADPFRALQEMDASRVSSFVRSAGTAANDTRKTVFRDVLTTGAELSDVMAKHLDLGDVAAEAASASANARRAVEVFDALENDVASVNQFRALEQGTGIERALVAQAGGFVLGGPLGAALATAIASPAVLARGLGAIERAAQRVSGRIDVGITRYVRNALERGRLVTATAGRVVQRAARGTRRTAVTLALGEYSRRSREAVDAAADPRRTLERIEERSQEIAASAPQTRAAFVQQSMRAAEFLAARVPPSSLPVQAALPRWTRRLPPSSAEQSRFLRYARAVDAPLTIVDDLEAGQVSPEAVEVARDLYPQIYGLMQAAVTRAFAEHARDGDDIPYSARMQLGQLFGADVDPTLNGAAIASAQAAFATAEAQSEPPRTGRASRVESEAFASLAAEPQTRTQQSEGRSR